MWGHDTEFLRALRVARIAAVAHAMVACELLKPRVVRAEHLLSLVGRFGCEAALAHERVMDQEVGEEDEPMDVALPVAVAAPPAPVVPVVTGASQPLIITLREAVRVPKSLQRDPSAPTTLEIAAQDYVSAFAEFSAMELLSKAHDLLVSVDKYELLAAKIDQDDLVDSLLELDTSKPAEPIAQVITSEIFASETKTHSWESKKRRAARKLLGGNAMTEKTTDQYATEFGDALGLDGETLESVLPAAATRAPAAVEEILAKGEDASDDEKSLVAAFHLMAVCVRAAPAPIGADVPKVFRPAWEVLLTVLKDVDANALGESR